MLIISPFLESSSRDSLCQRKIHGVLSGGEETPQLGRDVLRSALIFELKVLRVPKGGVAYCHYYVHKAFKLLTLFRYRSIKRLLSRPQYSHERA